MQLCTRVCKGCEDVQGCARGVRVCEWCEDVQGYVLVRCMRIRKGVLEV